MWIWRRGEGVEGVKLDEVEGGWRRGREENRRERKVKCRSRYQEVRIVGRGSCLEEEKKRGSE